MEVTLQQAKDRLDYLIRIGRVDLYKPIHIAEVLHRARTVGDIDPANVETYRLPSLAWRNAVTRLLQGKVSTSSAWYQHDVWNDTAMPPAYLIALDADNKQRGGATERYIYQKVAERRGTVAGVIGYIGTATADTFLLPDLLNLFVSSPGIRRSIDKAYEIITYALFETIVTSLETTVRVQVPESSRALLADFSDLAAVLLGLTESELSWEQDAHIFRVGVTNAADRGLDMWADFGPAIQVKHLTLNPALATAIVDQVEGQHVVIVCRDADAATVSVFLSQIGWVTCPHSMCQRWC